MEIRALKLNRLGFMLVFAVFLFQASTDPVAAEVTLVAPASYYKVTLAVGSSYYSDATYTIKTQPEGFENLAAIQTKNDDTNVSDSPHIVLNLSREATVYVAYDHRATALPGWLDSFTATGQIVESEGDGAMGYFNLYAQDFGPGPVELGGNACCGAAGAGSNYIVYVDEVDEDEELSVDPTALALAPGGSATATVSGGSAPYTLNNPGDPAVVTTQLTDSTLTVDAQAVGDTDITISDSAWNSVTVAVSVGVELAVNPATLTLPVGGVGTASVSGGTSPYAAYSYDPGVAAVELDAVSGDTLTVTGVDVGTTSIHVNDSETGTGSIGVTVVSPLGVSPQTLSLGLGETGTIAVTGGYGVYSVASGNESVATASVSGGLVTINGIGSGNISVTVSDTSGQQTTVIVSVGSVATPGLGDCPNPPFVIGTGVSPNILLILDHSGSMGNGPGSNWEVAKATLKSLLDEFPNLRFGLMRMDGSNYSGDDYWYSSTKVKRQGGKILKPCGTSAAEIKSYIDGWDTSNTPQTWTNLAETLASAGRYFATVTNADGNREGAGPQDLGYYVKNYHYTIDGNTYDATTTDDKGNIIDTTSPVQYYCQNSYVIFISDGLANYDNDWDLVTDVIGDYDEDNDSGDCKYDASNPTCPNQGEFFDDVAKYLYEHDLRSDMDGFQNITTYVIGFQIDNPLLSETARKGGGEYYTTTESSQLITMLRAVVKHISDKESSGTAVSTISTSSETDDYLIRARFKPVSQAGFLEAFTLPYHDGDTAAWEAGAKLQEKIATDGHASRRIYTYMSSQVTKKQLFDASNEALKLELKAGWGTGTDAETMDVMNYLRGDATYDGSKYRDRKDWFLGDIIYSTPVSVGPPKFYYMENDYQTFKYSNLNRTRMVYVGANDGMLHAFNAADGSEEWVFIPENIQSKLINLTLADCHKYYVDLTPFVTDVWDGSSWKTLLIGGNRLGGGEYFCLDVTDPAHDQFAVLWDYTPFSHAKSSTLPVVGRMRGNGVDEWLAVVTSGYTEDPVEGKIAALSFANGNKESIWYDGTGAVDQLSTQVKGVSRPYYSLTSPVAVDSDRDGWLDLVYAGDTEGSVWKFYYDYEEDGWKRLELFQTGGQSITTRLTLAFDQEGRLRIYFGTGKYLVESDKFNSTQNAFYCLVEKKVTTEDNNNGHFTNSATISKSNDLIDVTGILTETDFADPVLLTPEDQEKIDQNGWYFLLDQPLGPAERVVEEAVVISGNVFFTSFIPNQDACGYGGNSRLYAVDYKKATVGMVGDHKALPGVLADSRYKNLGAGLPSKPVFYFDRLTKETQLIIQTSDTRVNQEPINTEERPMVVNSWKIDTN
ncbi:MAG: PQQ-binding-like beta-propeller repeat protein [Desulfobacterales bacterium]|nr:MAG: PQQ-binding-like beta-propeller repeat protein [Desulfobacterales bacterium]